jgi:hypothetical protein
LGWEPPPPKRRRALCPRSSLSTRSERRAVTAEAARSSLLSVEPVYLIRALSRHRRGGIELVARGRASLCTEPGAVPPKRSHALGSENELVIPTRARNQRRQAGSGIRVRRTHAVSEDIAPVPGRLGEPCLERLSPLRRRRGSKAAPPGRCVAARARTCQPEYCIQPTSRNPRELPPPSRLSGIPTWAALPAIRS